MTSPKFEQEIRKDLEQKILNSLTQVKTKINNLDLSDQALINTHQLDKLFSLFKNNSQFILSSQNLNLMVLELDNISAMIDHLYYNKNIDNTKDINHINIIFELIYNRLQLNLRNTDNSNKEIKDLKNDLKNSNSTLDNELENSHQIKFELDKKIDELSITNKKIQKDLTSANSTIDELNKIVDSKKSELHNLIQEQDGLREKIYELENAPIRKVYSEATNKYSQLEQKNRKYFFIGIVVFLVITISLFLCKSLIINLLNNDPDNSIIEFWVLKISIMLIGITLLSYFLKQASHYQKLADQNHQTEVELQAYPNFMNSVSPEISAEVKKELALKYFGREIDGTPHKDMSNLISDQMKSTTELVKATTESIKNLKGKPF